MPALVLLALPACHPSLAAVSIWAALSHEIPFDNRGVHRGQENVAQRVPTAPPRGGGGTEILKSEGLVPQMRRQLCSSLRSLGKTTTKKKHTEMELPKIKAWL